MHSALAVSSPVIWHGLASKESRISRRVHPRDVTGKCALIPPDIFDGSDAIAFARLLVLNPLRDMNEDLAMIFGGEKELRS